MSTDRELIDSSIQQFNTRAQASKDCRVLVKRIGSLTGLKSESVHRLKSCWVRRGNGWGDDKVTLAKGAENPDIVTTLLARLAQIIADHEQAGLLDDLAPYFEDLSKHGIDIKVDTDKTGYFNDVHSQIVDLASYQQVIDECDEEVKELGQEAESIQFSPKDRFPTVAQLAYKKSKGKDIGDKCQQGIEQALLYEKALTSIQAMSFD